MAIVGMDLGKFKTAVCVMEEDGSVVREEKVEMTRDAIQVLLRGVPTGSKVAMEATFNSGWVTDMVRAEGLDPHVGHPRHLRAISQTKTKTDAIDARKLAHLLRTGFFPEAYTANPETRALRSLVRQRAFLSRQRTRVKNRIHTTLAGLGHRQPEGALFTRRGQAWMKGLELGPMHAGLLKQLIAVMDYLSKQLKAIGETIDEQQAVHPYAIRLETMPGIGHYGALLLACEIDRIDRFPDPARLSSYAGLVPTVKNSGNSVRIGHLSKEGNRWMKWILIEAAQRAWRPSHPFHGFYLRVKRRKGSKIARVAVARRLVEAAYWMLMRNQDFRSPETGKEGATQVKAIPA